ncbi:helix-turn-helix domain-containing protein [Blautia obeum]|uniref:helix-turn-helix domain-containing protein n=1 Tax=Blautia obeum TaxID=40520 RepID=UPI001D07B53E|nr:helix-turn-helix domain-containing protein [Blautia obeum]MCB7341851.1 helix-turn-helix domain-containing protein [Blautia obeum]
MLKKDLNVQIGQRVRSARKQAHLSREALAEKLDISTLFLGYIECGQKGMSLSTLQKLCQVLGVSSDFILMGIDDDSTHKNNFMLLVDSVDPKYHPLLECNLRCTIDAINETEKLK